MFLTDSGEEAGAARHLQGSEPCPVKFCKVPCCFPTSEPAGPVPSAASSPETDRGAFLDVERGVADVKRWQDVCGSEEGTESV